VCNVKLVGERASADHDATKAFPAELATFIEEKGYLLEQVVNADETGLFWKKMLTKMLISEHESKAAGFKAANDEGDFMVRPMMLYRSVNPCALKNENKQVLHVHWRTNRKASVTSVVIFYLSALSRLV